MSDSVGDSKRKKETKLGLAHSKEADFGDWYSEVVVESEMISYYDVSGFFCSSTHWDSCLLIITPMFNSDGCF